MIKAALNAYGQDGIFQLSKTSESNYRAVLKNGNEVSFTDAELELARQAAGFKLKRNTPYSLDLKQQAEVAFCVMAKHKLNIDKKYVTIHGEKLEQNKYESFEAVLSKLKSGGYTPTIYINI